MILIEIFFAIILGTITGIVSGLTPGIHINMISLLVLSSSSFIIDHFGLNLVTLGVFIIVVGITHTFLDAVPSIFLGAPDESNALGVLPGHRYLLRGNGLMAVKLFTIGSFFGLILGIILFPLLYFFTKYAYHGLEKYFAWILIGTSIFMLWRDEKKVWAILVFLLSSILGLTIFSMDIKDPLFPLLSGLFGISTLIISFNDNNNIPEQNIETYTKLEGRKTFMSLIAGNISAFIVSTFPGLSSSIAAVMSIQFFRDLGDKGFMILLGCIGTSSFILSLVALYTVDKARNGAVIVISKLLPDITLNIILVFLAVALISGAVSTFLALWFGKIFSKMISRINYRLLVTIIIVFVTSLVIIMTSWKGLLVLITATTLGLIPGIVKVQRTQSMACLIVPVIFYLL
ncbi:MAG: tripartite tricarboxylate transporter permease [Candidatus Woesearchaeota archaeon]